MSRLAVIFSGVGYTTDRPLLYYAGRLAVAHGYEVVSVDFSGIRWSKEELKDHRRFAEILDECLKKTELKLSGVKMGSMEEIVFISKSIGTVAAAAYAQKAGLSVRQILFTPLEYISNFVEDGNGLVFYGDADPFARPEEIARICHEKKLEAHVIAGANHSLETEDTMQNIDHVKRVMMRVEDFLKKS